MKLRNKKTGEIWDIGKILTNDYPCWETLKQLNEEWEDYEEPKEQYYIDCDGEVYAPTRLNQFDLDRMSNIGNIFETRVEAEKAVEKLKAWKRLKDMNPKIRILSTTSTYSEIIYNVAFGFTDGYSDELYRDIKLLFGEK